MGKLSDYVLAAQQGISEAPNDGLAYARQSLGWTSTWTRTEAEGRYAPLNHNHDTLYAPLVHTHSEYLEDAPSNGTIYGRQNGNWVEAGGGEANEDWLRADINDVKTGGYLRFNNGLQLQLGSSGHTQLHGDTTNSYLDLNSGNFFIRSGSTTRFTFARSTGHFTTVGNVIAYSDLRLKKEIEVIEDALAKVRRIRGITYTDIETGELRTGVIAQELDKVLPQAVHENEDGMLSVAYGNVIGLLIEAIKELEDRVDDLANLGSD